MQVIGWQYRIPQHTLARFNLLRTTRGDPPKEPWWVMTLFSTKEEAERAGSGGYEGWEHRPGMKEAERVSYPPNIVRPVYSEAP